MKKLILTLIIGSAAVAFATSAQANPPQLRVHCTASRTGPVGGGVANVSGLLTLMPFQPMQYMASGTLDIFLYRPGGVVATFKRQRVRGAQTHVIEPSRGVDLNGISLGALGNNKIAMVFMDLNVRDRSYVEYEDAFYMMNCAN